MDANKLKDKYLKACDKIGKDAVDRKWNDLLNRILRGPVKAKATNAEINAMAVEIVEYLNLKVFGSYRPTAQDCLPHIKARLAEKYTVEDFKNVIDIKSKQWLGSEKMGGNLRPKTLFGTGFSGYLREWKYANRDKERTGMSAVPVKPKRKMESFTQRSARIKQEKAEGRTPYLYALPLDANDNPIYPEEGKDER